MNECNSIELVSINRLPLRMRPVVENIASSGIDAEDMHKYSSASIWSIGNRLECCCQKPNGSVLELVHFIVM